jgi:hypothetical protein
MAVVRDKLKRSTLMDDSIRTSVDYSAAARRYTLVDSTSDGAGNETLQNVAGQGANFVGVLVNNPTTADMAAVRWLGIEEIRADSAITAGDEVTAAGAGGTIETAGAGDYVCGTAREDGVADQCVSCRLRKYQRN